ncbi:MAG: YqeG family HAD IIIA-type phosphatase [Firmicutes bacterium]|nr:YqeG family HAD IIIA-type phosphatase [Bacillota bacterium]
MWNLVCPRLYVESIFAIPLDDIWRRGIRGLIFDVDNTLTGWRGKELDAETLQWFGNLAERGFQICLVSNSGQQERVMAFGRLLNVCAIPRAYKPMGRAFREALKKLKTGPASTAVIGDQIFTDVLGGNRLGLYTILVVPLSKREFIGTKCVRLLERLVLKALARRNLLRNQV